MKKIMVILLSIIIAISFCACSNPQTIEDEAGAEQLVSPIEDVAIEELYEFLGIEKANIDNFEILGVSKIADEYEIYSVDLKKNGKEYNVRFAQLNGNYGDDISGVYLNGEINSVIYDSTNVDIAPTMTIESDREYSKAYGEWKGLIFSVSSDRMKNDDMNKISNEFLKAFLDSVVLYH